MPEPTEPRRGPLASVVIPAHDEERTIATTLRTLFEGVSPEDLDVVVVCNGCTDRTAAVVRDGFPSVRVVELAKPSKTAAVAAGNIATDVFPRVHLDADVRVSGTSVAALADALDRDGLLAVAPERVLERSASSPVVRWYYDVWEHLPQVRDGLFGRGAFALTEEGQARVSALPRLMSDDLVVSEAFAPSERGVVPGAVSRVQAPRRLGDLVRRRVRVATGNVQASEAGARSEQSETTVRTLVGLARDPRVAVRLPVFLGVTAVARFRARRAVRAGDYDTWLRDESSRG